MTSTGVPAALSARGSGRLAAAIRTAAPQRVGVITAVVGLSAQVSGLRCAVGELVVISGIREGEAELDAEVVAVGRDSLTVMPLGPLSGLAQGAQVRARNAPLLVPTGTGLLGRVLDGMGRPLDGLGPLAAGARVPLDNCSPNSMERARIRTPLGTGVRVMDTLAAVGQGQRMGLFAGSGVGKSSLLSMIARGTEADVSVIALVGERGREVREFLEDDLGPAGLARSIVVVATSDEPALVRMRAAFLATRIAESFRETGAHVMLMMDSLTRVAMAQREIGLSVGEPPATRGYPPSTFSLLARLLERAGTGKAGSVTGIYTVLVDGDDHNEPIADAVRSLLDGHIVLERKLAVAGHFPSVDALASISRVAAKVCTPEQKHDAGVLRRVLAARRGAQDLIDVGAYQSGANPLVDAALLHQGAINAFLQQDLGHQVPAADAWAELRFLVELFGELP